MQPFLLVLSPILKPPHILSTRANHTPSTDPSLSLVVEDAPCLASQITGAGADQGPGSYSNVSTFCKSRNNRGAPQVSISDLSTEPRPTKLIIQIVFREKASLLLFPDHKIKMHLCLKSAAKRKKWKQKFTLSLSDVTAVKLFFSVLLPWA